MFFIKVLYLITTRHAELELCNFSWKLIGNTKNPGISWQHLAWQIFKGGGYQFTSQQMFWRYTYLLQWMRLCVKWLAHSKCKWPSAAASDVFLMPSQGAKCPQFENPDPVLIPVGYKTRISFEGINLNLYQVKWQRHRSYSISGDTSWLSL